MNTEGPPKPPPKSFLQRGREFLKKLRRPHADKLEKFKRQGTTDMMGALGGPGGAAARETLEKASEQVTEDKPPVPPETPET